MRKNFRSLIRDEGVAAVRAYKAERRCDNLAGDKGLPTDFALELPIAAIIIVEIVVEVPHKEGQKVSSGMDLPLRR